MEIKIIRFSSNEDATLGLLYVDSKFYCYTLEDQHQKVKVKGETRIPPGDYDLELRDEGGMTKRYADRFDFHAGMLWLRNVPEFEYIYIHVGNNDDHSEGCILVGDGQVQNVTERGQVTSSVAAYTRLYHDILKALALESVHVVIEDQD